MARVSTLEKWQEGQETEADVVAAEQRLAQACTSRAHEPEDFQPGLRRWENKEHAPF